MIIVLAPETQGMSQCVETMWMRASDWLRESKNKGPPLVLAANQYRSNSDRKMTISCSRFSALQTR